MPVLDLALRVARRLRFFPFSLVFLAIGALLRRIELRRGRARHVLVGIADGPAARAALLAAGQAPTDLLVDAGTGTEGEGAVSSLFAAFLAIPTLRSVGVYFDAGALQQDLPLWGARDEGGSGAAARLRPVPYAGAQREGELLLTRLAGGRLVYVLDDRRLSLEEAQGLAAESPEFLFVDLAGRGGQPPGERPGNLVPLGAAGLGLHQKLGLVRSADMYIGSDPILAAAAPRTAELPALRMQGGLRNRLRGRPVAGDTIH